MKKDASKSFSPIDLEKKYHGIALHLSSIRSAKSAGIGEFLDLLPLIDFLKDTEFSIIQLLPINDTGPDPSPYNALSSIALHPIYLSLHALPFLPPHLKKVLPSFDKLNDTKLVAYETVLEKKKAFLEEYFVACKDLLLKEKGFKQFKKDFPVLKTYAEFKAKREANLHSHWMEWDPSVKPQKERIEYFYLLQYLCFSQFVSVKEYAEKQKIFIKGDIPILVSPNSADVYANTHLFDLKRAAGAPPDMFNNEQQYWGFPIPLYSKMKKEHFSWWKDRIDFSNELYHLFRIDHVVGFYHIWSILRDKPHIKGHYTPSDIQSALIQGETQLQAIVSFAKMQPIAEDLGKIPDEVKNSLKKLHIPGTKVFRWELECDEHEKAFIPFENYPKNSLSTVSTHDSSTLAEWWQEDPDAKLFADSRGWKYSPHLDRETRAKILLQIHHTPSVFHINLFQEYLALIPSFVSSSIEEERINRPGTILPTNWVYRIRPTVEEISASKALKNALRNIANDPKAT